MKYYVELSDNVNDITMGRLYPIDGNFIYDDAGDRMDVSKWEDATGYVVGLDVLR